jgi:hypothetical protein
MSTPTPPEEFDLSSPMALAGSVEELEKTYTHHGLQRFLESMGYAHDDALSPSRDTALLLNLDGEVYEVLLDASNHYRMRCLLSRAQYGDLDKLLTLYAQVRFYSYSMSPKLRDILGNMFTRKNIEEARLALGKHRQEEQRERMRELLGGLEEPPSA